jgi:hypothetical protein
VTQAGVEYFAGDLTPEEKQIVWATAMTQRHPASAWRSSQAPRVQ